MASDNKSRGFDEDSPSGVLNSHHLASSASKCHSQSAMNSPFTRLCKTSNIPLSRDSFPKLRFGHSAILAIALVIHLVDGTNSPTVYIPLTFFVILAMIWVEKAESHEGPRTPDFMSPPSIEDIATELQHLQSYAVSDTSDTSDEDSLEEIDSETSNSKAPINDRAMVWREQKGKSVYVPKFYPPLNKSKAFRTDMTMDEVSKHNTKDDCWVVIESHVYDVSKFVPNHPGGWLNLENMAGKDCTDAFANYHPASVYRTLLPAFYIGDVVDSLDDDPFTVEHRSIRQDLLRRGLFETNLYFYYLKVLWLATLLFVAVWMTLSGTTLMRRMSGAIVMAGFWHQLAFIGHDIGHNSISHTQWNDTFFGILFGNTLGGIGLGWWKHSHNVHHVVCNSVQHDPDIQHMPLFAIADDIFDARKLKEGGCYNEEKNGFWSSFHQKYISPDIVSRFLVSNQHYLFYPIMAVARFNLYIQGWIFALNAKHHDAWFAKRYQTMELLTLSTFLVWVSVLVGSLPLYERGLWLLLSHAFAGILHVQICISHFTMDVYHGHAYNDSSDEWFKMQCNTTMNVDCPRWMDFVHGGLQFQIEHHLFPRLPRHNLREARALVKPFCAKWKVKYHEKTFFDSNVELVNGLKSVAYKCRMYGLGSVGGFKNTQIYEGLNAEG